MTIEKVLLEGPSPVQSSLCGWCLPGKVYNKESPASNLARCNVQYTTDPHHPWALYLYFLMGMTNRKKICCWQFWWFFQYGRLAGPWVSPLMYHLQFSFVVPVFVLNSQYSALTESASWHCPVSVQACLYLYTCDSFTMSFHFIC